MDTPIPVSNVTGEILDKVSKSCLVAQLARCTSFAARRSLHVVVVSRSRYRRTTPRTTT